MADFPNRLVNHLVNAHGMDLDLARRVTPKMRENWHVRFHQDEQFLDPDFRHDDRKSLATTMFKMKNRAEDKRRGR